MLFSGPLLHPEGGEGSAGGSGSSQGGDGKPGGDGAAGAGGAGDKSGGDAGQKGQEGSEPQYVTAEQLKGVLASSTKALTKELSGLLDPLKTQLESQSDELEKLRIAPKEPAKDSKGDGKEKDSTELAELRRKVAEQGDAISKAHTELKTSKETAKVTKFEQIVLDALTRAECTKPNAVLRMIGPDLEYDPDKDPNRVFKTVKSDFGEEELEIDLYIKREVAEKDMPELFKGKHRPGSPAGGDQGGGDGEYLFTMSQIADPEFYVKNQEAIRTALETGKVKGAKSEASK